MSGILNSTGAVSGILGTTVGTPAATTAATLGAGVLPVGVTGGSGLDATPLNNRNMIINGGMKIWQRATGATAATTVYDTVDRFLFYEVTDGAYTSEKHAMSLAEINTTGHSSAIALNVTTADGTIAAGQYSYFAQYVEAQNCQHLQWGTAAAKDATLSFWVKSKIAGTYCITFEKADSTTYRDIKEYTIDDADTWEYKTITITPTDGSTTLITGAGGIIVNDTGKGISILFGLAWGSTYHNTKDIWSTNSDYSTDQQVNWMSSTSNDFYITGIQFEAGSVATPFEHRSFGDELVRCMRYYEFATYSGVVLIGYSSSYGRGSVYLSTPKRIEGYTATVVVADGTAYWGNAAHTGIVFTTSQHEEQCIRVNTDAAPANSSLYINNCDIRVDAEL
jgi:hypothetical protein